TAYRQAKNSPTTTTSSMSSLSPLLPLLGQYLPFPPPPSPPSPPRFTSVFAVGNIPGPLPHVLRACAPSLVASHVSPVFSSPRGPSQSYKVLLKYFLLRVNRI